MDAVNKAVWTKFHIHHGDTLPFRGYQGGRDELAELWGELGFKAGAEVGVEHGRFAATICRAARGVALKCVDPWRAFSHHTDAEMEDIYQNARLRLDRFGVEFIRKPSLEAVRDVADGSLDFVYVDGLHDFDSVIQDVIQWSAKVRPGGIVAGHDYFKTYGYGVIHAVDAYTRAHNINMWYITTELESPSFFWVK